MLAGGALATAAARLAGLASLGVASIVIGRALGPGGYGTFAVAFSLQWFILATASIGLANGIGYEVATGRWMANSAIRHGVVASIVLGVAGGAGGAVLLVVAGGDLLPGVSTAAIATFLAGIPLGLALVVLVGIAVALERYEAAAVMLAGQSIVIAVLAGAASLPFELSATVAAIGIGLFVTGLFSVIWALRLVSALDRQPNTLPGSPRFRESIRFGAQTWTADLINLINVRVDLILVAAFASASEAGLYAVAATIASLGVVVPEAFAQVLLPRIGALDQEGGPANATTTVRAAGRHSVISAAGTSLALLVGVLLIPVFYGPKFDDSVVLGLILIPGVAAFGISRVLGYVLAGLGRPMLSGAFRRRWFCPPFWHSFWSYRQRRRPAPRSSRPSPTPSPCSSC